MSREYGRVFFLAFKKEKPTSMQYNLILVNIWRRQIHLHCIPKFHHALHQLFGNKNIGGKTRLGWKIERLRRENRNRIPFMKFTWVVGKENPKMIIAHLAIES